MEGSTTILSLSWEKADEGGAGVLIAGWTGLGEATGVTDRAEVGVGES